MSPEREELARYQAALIEELSSDRPPSEIVARLRGHGFDDEVDAALAEADLRAVEVASLLVRKWGRPPPRGVER